MADPNKMIRTDGTKVTIQRQTSWKFEFYALWIALRTDPLVILLFPMFFASNWFYTWRQSTYHRCIASANEIFSEFNEYNAAIFNIRARSLNNLVYWITQIFGSVSIGFLLDKKDIARRVRAFCGWAVLFVMVFIVHIWGYVYQRSAKIHRLGSGILIVLFNVRTYTRASIPTDASKMDIRDKAYPVHIWLYIFCGILDAMWQTTAYWVMGAMSNNPAKLAYFIGFCMFCTSHPHR
jgi:hypothetical protein